MKSNIPRRQFLKRGLAAVGAAVAAPHVIAASALGKDGAVAPSERIGMGFFGAGCQGGGHIVGGAWTYLPGGYAGRADAQVLAVCDVQRDRRDAATNTVNSRYADRYGKGNYKSCQAYVDFRDVLARDDIDAVLVCTPIHWHALMSIMAARAGKDVYCEKPTALTIRESRAVVETVKRYGRIYQAGTQQRSEYDGRFRIACELVRNGHIGELKKVYSYQSGGGWGCGTDQGIVPGQRNFDNVQSVPDNLDWELWLGPAPWYPYQGNLDTHRFGWGSINWGQHHYDICQWGLNGDRTGPVEIHLENGKPVYTYASGVVLYGTEPEGQKWDQGGAHFVGTEGTITVHRERLESSPVEIVRRPLRANDVPLYHSDSHGGNFLECIRTRQQTIVDAETAHRAISILLLGGICERLKRPLKWDPVKEEFENDTEANQFLTVAMRAPWHI